MEIQPVRAIDLDRGLIEGLAIPFDGPMQGRDLHGETFKSYTNLHLDWFESRPLLYQHGLDEDLKAVAVGRQIKATETERGMWAEAQLDMAHEYSEQVKKLLAEGALYFSSGSMRHLVKVQDGIITDWPWVELSLTPTPANPYAIVDAGKSFDYMSEALRHTANAAARGIAGDGKCKCGNEARTVHYRDGDSENLSPRNLVKLCADCHKAAHESAKKSDPIKSLWLSYQEALTL